MGRQQDQMSQNALDTEFELRAGQKKCIVRKERRSGQYISRGQPVGPESVLDGISNWLARLHHAGE